MTITRIIDGKLVEITLTPAEIWEVCRSVEHETDITDVQDIAAELEDDEGLEPFTAEEIRDVADDLRDHMDSDLYVWGTNDIRQFVEERLLELREEV